METNEFKDFNFLTETQNKLCLKEKHSDTNQCSHSKIQTKITKQIDSYKLLNNFIINLFLNSIKTMNSITKINKNILLTLIFIMTLNLMQSRTAGHRSYESFCR